MREGKCRRCGDRWNPKHRCRPKDNSKKLYTCEVEENSQSEEEEDEESKDEEEATANMESGSDETPKISLAAMTGISQPQNLKLKGHIKNENVTVLVDTGSTHNFLDIRVSRKLKLFVQPVPNMKVMVINAKKIEKVEKCHKVKIQIQDFKLESELYTLPLSGVDIVLGVQWLQTLRTYSANHQKHFIKFKWQGKNYKLHGFQPPDTQVVSSQQMEKLKIGRAHV